MARKRDKEKSDTKDTKNQQQYKSVKKDSTFDYLADHLFNKATAGMFDHQTNDFQISFNRIFSETYRKEVYQIIQYPTEVPVGHLENIRDRLRNALPFNIKDNFDLHIVQHIKNNGTDVTGAKMTRLRLNANNSYMEQLRQINLVEEAMRDGRARSVSGITTQDVILAKQKLKKMERKADSYEAVLSHRLEGKSYNRTYVFLELACKSQEDLAIASKQLQGILQAGYNHEPYIFRQIDIDLLEYLRHFGVASLLPQTGKKDLFPPMDVTSNVNAIAEAFKPGVIKDGHQDIYIGHLLANNYPYYISFRDSTDASNILVLADSGSGKTTWVKTVALYALSNPKQHIIVNDYKGTEMDVFLELLGPENVGKISFSISDSKIINTFKIIDYRLLNYKSPKQAYTLSAHFTTDGLVALVDPPEEKESIIESICSDIVYQVYASHGVDILVPDTYKKADEICYSKDIWRVLESITFAETKKANATDRNSKSWTKYNPDDLNLVRSRLVDYFHERGSKITYFAEEEDLSDIINKRLIIVNHGAQSAGGAMKTKAEKRFGRLQAFYFSTLYTGVNYSHHESTLEIQEEVAQIFGDKYACERLCADVTGCRSLNKTNILITNSITPLVKPTVNEEYLESIKVNMNIFLLGKCQKSEASRFLDYIDREEIADTVKLVSQQVHPEYRHAFMYYDKTQNRSRVVKLRIPKSVTDTFMRSRDVDDMDVM